MDRIADFRNVFAQMVVARGGCPHNEALLRAFASVPRHVFVGDGPWMVTEAGARTVSADPALVYQDIGIGLGPGVPTGLPSLHALLLDAAAVPSGARVMQVGAGTGYFTAILAELVGPSGQVRGFEIDEQLAARAQRNLTAWPWAAVEARSGVIAAEAAVDRFDLLYVNAGVQQLPAPWLDALTPGGRLVFPLVAASGQGAVFLIRRDDTAFAARLLSRARFVPCIGTQDLTAGARLDEVFRSDAPESVQTLWRCREKPTETAWQVGEGTWFASGPTEPPRADPAGAGRGVVDSTQ
jgi:protein-L-isoaspartate(D-aspartate) O-methyltransferase